MSGLCDDFLVWTLVLINPLVFILLYSSIFYWKCPVPTRCYAATIILNQFSLMQFSSVNDIRISVEKRDFITFVGWKKIKSRTRYRFPIAVRKFVPSSINFVYITFYLFSLVEIKVWSLRSRPAVHRRPKYRRKKNKQQKHIKHLGDAKKKREKCKLEV